MAKLTREDILHLAKLARLELSEEEITAYQSELSEVLSYIDQLGEVDVTGLEPTYQVNDLSNVTRKDEIYEYGTSQEDLLKNAPQTDSDGHIKVKRVLT